MTLHIVDVSRHQVERPDPLDLVRYAEWARSLGLGVCTYRWLDGRLSGAESALRAYRRIQELGGPDGMAHAVDCEETPDKGPPATQAIWRDYVNAMQDYLGRPIVAYSADWWWERYGWGGAAAVTPYLWAAPNDGYRPAYPGDDAPQWWAGYGGWSALSVMQYAVNPLPGTGNCSLSAIRDSRVWTVLTEGGAMPWRVARGLDVLLGQLNAHAPGRSTASDGSIGDANHSATSDHAAKDFPGWGNDIVTARDFTHDPADGADMGVFTEQLRISRDPRIKYVIWQQKMFSSYATSQYPAWTWRPYSGTYHGHGHVSTVGDSRADGTQSWAVYSGGNMSTEKATHNAYLYARGAVMLDEQIWVFPENQITSPPGSELRPNPLAAGLRDIQDNVTELVERPAGTVTVTDEQMRALGDQVLLNIGPAIETIVERVVARTRLSVDAATD